MPWRVLVSVPVCRGYDQMPEASNPNIHGYIHGIMKRSICTAKAIPVGYRISSGGYQNLGLNRYYSTSTLNPTLWYIMMLFYNSSGFGIPAGSKNIGKTYFCFIIHS